MGAGLLVGDEREHEAPGRKPCGANGSGRVDHGRHGRLHVARAEPVQLAVLDHGIPRIRPPGLEVARRLRVEVTAQHQRPPRLRAGNAGEDVRPSLDGGELLHVGDAEPL